jgi:formamidopyrimidine-DNA glycosylase
VPELPEVQTIVSRLSPVVAGRRIEGLRLLRRDIVRQGPVDVGRRLKGRRIAAVGRRGKRIILEFASGEELCIHLGMTGAIFLAPAAAPLAKHTHMRMRLRGLSSELRFKDPRRFGGIWMAGPWRKRAEGRFSAELGPDALRIRLPEFRALTARRRQIKQLLLDQSKIAGLGNIYTDEALFLARIHPRKPAADIGERGTDLLLKSIRKVLRAAIAAGGSSIRDYVDVDGEPGWFQLQHKVYGREGKPCLRCGEAVERIVVGSRSTHFCPCCQGR